MKDFGLHNALAVLLLIVGGAVITGFGVLAFRIGETWTPANTNFLTASMGIGCVVAMVVFAFFCGGALWAITGALRRAGLRAAQGEGAGRHPPRLPDRGRDGQLRARRPAATGSAAAGRGRELGRSRGEW